MRPNIKPCGRPPKYDAQKIRELLTEGLTHTKIAACVGGCHPSYISFVKLHGGR